MTIRAKVHLFAWMLLAVSVLINLASFVWDLYDQVWWYDKVVHIFTSFAFTLPLPALLRGRVLTGFRRHRFLMVVLITCLGVALGTFWEIFEWGFSQLWGDPNLLEKRVDVVTDLIVDAIGALPAAWLGNEFVRKALL
jgi:hypothetical protein